MMISDKMNAKLNTQIAAEFSSAHTYLAMACTLDHSGLKILSNWFIKQAAEEREHAMKILHYIQQVGAEVALDAVPKPAGNYGDVEALVQTALKHEHKITSMINDLVALADTEKDYSTRSFLNWFVDEQVEEVASMADLLTLVKLSRGNMLQVETRLRHQMADPH